MNQKRQLKITLPIYEKLSLTVYANNTFNLQACLERCRLLQPNRAARRVRNDTCDKTVCKTEERGLNQSPNRRIGYVVCWIFCLAIKTMQCQHWNSCNSMAPLRLCDLRPSTATKLLCSTNQSFSSFWKAKRAYCSSFGLLRPIRGKVQWPAPKMHTIPEIPGALICVQCRFA